MLKLSSFIILILIGCKSDQVSFNGTIRMVGNMPFAQLVITSNGTDYQFTPKDKRLYKSMQGKKVTFYGRVETKKMVSASGRHSFEIYMLETDSLHALPSNF